MRISELIKDLKEAMEEYGDYEVAIFTDESGYKFSRVMVIPDTLAKIGENIFTLEPQMEEKE